MEHVRRGNGVAQGGPTIAKKVVRDRHDGGAGGWRDTRGSWPWMAYSLITEPRAASRLQFRKSRQTEQPAFR